MAKKKHKKPTKHELKKKGKKVSKKERSSTRKNAGHRPTKRATKTSRETVKRKKPAKKADSKSKILGNTKQGKTGKRTVVKAPAKTRSKTASASVEHPRRKQNINISFKGVRKVENKIALFEESANLKKALTNQLKRKKGKPPKGIIIIVKDKKGAEAAHVSKPSFVANEKNINKELQKFTKELKKDYSKFAQELADIEAEGGQEVETEGYENYNPDNISSIEIKFIY